MNRRSLLLGAAAFGMESRFRRVSETGPPRVSEHLFLDDLLIEEKRGVERILHRPRKRGLIREADGRPWARGDQLSVVRSSKTGRFQMTYRFIWEDPAVRELHPSIGEDRAHWFRQTVGYAVSEDGIRWSKPDLGLLEGPTGFRRAPQERWKDGVFWEPSGMSRRNNLGCPVHTLQDLQLFGRRSQLGAPEGNPDAGRVAPGGRYLVHVLETADTHPFAEIRGGGLYFADEVPDLARDPDWRRRMRGIWEGRHRGARGPAVRVAGYDETEQVWVECAQCTFSNIVRHGQREIARWTSKNLKDWAAEDRVLPVAADESREPRDWVEYMDIRVCRIADAWLGQLIVFHGDRSSPQYQMPTQPAVWRKGTTEMRLVVSRDAGNSWQRVGGRQAWIPHHPEEDGYDRLVFTGSPARVGDELWLYYGCWDGDHLVWNRDGTTFYRDRVRIGRTALATIRWNGFASLRSGRPAGFLVTKPILVGGSRIQLNAAAAGGSIRVEIQDEAGRPVPGFRLADCQPVAGNGLEQSVRWRSKKQLPEELAARPLRLRFEIRGADLFGFTARR